MDTNRKRAIAVGVLYIIGTVCGVLSGVFTAPVLDGPDVLASVAANEPAMQMGVLMILTMGLALALVPVVLYPVFRRNHPTLALAYVVFRGALETVGYLLCIAAWLLLITVAREFALTGAESLRPLSAVILGWHTAINPLVVIVFSLDAVMIYTLFFRTRLVPRWIAVWGYVAIAMNFATAFLQMFWGVDVMAPSLSWIYAPIFLQEMVMAVWLIVKGFNRPALAVETADRSGENALFSAVL